MSVGDNLIFVGVNASAGTQPTNQPARLYSVVFYPSTTGWVGVFDSVSATPTPEEFVAPLFLTANVPATLAFDDAIIAGRQFRRGMSFQPLADPDGTLGGAATFGSITAFEPGTFPG